MNLFINSFKNFKDKINSYQNASSTIGFEIKKIDKNTLINWINSDHFQLKAFFITLIIFVTPLILFIFFLSAMAQNFQNVATCCLLIYAALYEILRRYIANGLANKKIIKDLISENEELKHKLKRKRRGSANIEK